MDNNNNAPQTGLDINPDMMTTQTSFPGVTPVPVATDPLSTPVVPKGVIDITPGAIPDQHDAKTVDITPTGSIPPVTTPSPVVTPVVESEHLVDMVPAPVAPVVAETPAITTPATPVIPSTPPQSPLAEDPDLVKLTK